MMMSVYFKLILYCLACFFLLGFCYYFSKKRKEFYVWNQKHSFVIWILLPLGIALCFLQLVIPFYAIPFSILSVIFLLLSGRVCGIVFYNAVVVFYTIFFSLSGTESAVLILTGLVGFLLFYSMDQSFRYYGSIAAFLAVDFTMYCTLLFEDGPAFSVRDFWVYSGIRIFAILCVLLIFLKLMHDLFVCRDENFFLLINDPEHELLMHLKTIDEAAYYHAVHTAYFADKMAKLIGADVMLAKALGYYHRIGLLQGKDTIQNTLTVASSYKFPASLQNAMQEYGIKTVEHVSKEAAIVQICDAFVSSVTFLFQKDSDAEMDYEKLTDVIIKKKFESHDFENCELSLEELYVMKKGFVGEKQYYDFLRGK